MINQQQLGGIQPMDYASQVRNPFEASLHGIQTGVGLAGAMRQSNEYEQKQQERLKAEEAQKLMQADLGALAMGVKNGTVGGTEFAGMIAKYPQLSEHFKRGFDIMDAGKKEVSLGQASQVYAALVSNKPDIAKALLDEQATAARNSGDEPGAKAAETLSQLVEMSPETAKTSAGLMLSSVLGKDKFADTFGKLEDQNRARDKAPGELALADANTIIKQAEANLAPRKLAAELGIKEEELKRLRAETGGAIPADKRPDAEARFRKEYSDQTKAFQDVNAAYGRIKASEASGAGDIALIFNYMKMLDPGSTVREGEFATAENAGGAWQKAGNMYNKLMSGERLNEPQRKMFLSQSDKLWKSAQEQEGKVRSGITRIAKGYGLNTDNIFYETGGVVEPASQLKKTAQPPQGMPQGSSQVGHTPDGKPVWQAPDGKRYIE